MKKLKKSIPSLLVAGIFLLTFVLLVLQFNTVMVYFDDFAYYSLSYSGTSQVYFDHYGDYVHEGTEFTLGELTWFLGKHYFVFNGRLLYYFVWLFLFWLGGMTLVRVTAAAAVTGVLYLLYRVCARSCGSAGQRIFAAAVTAMLYWVLDISLLHQGVYWFSAFFHYAMPVVFLLWAGLTYFSHEGQLPVWKKALLCVGIFLSSYSQEQQAVATVCFAVMLMVHSGIRRKESWKTTWPYLLSALAGLLLIFCSPALWRRLGYSTGEGGFLAGLVAQLRTVMYLFYNTSNGNFTAMLFVALACLSLGNLIRGKNWLAGLWDLLCAGGAGFVVWVYVTQPTQIELLLADPEVWKPILTGTAVAAVIAVQVVRCCLREKDELGLTVFVTAVLSVACLAFVPTLPNRLMTLPTFLLFTVIVRGLRDTAALLPKVPGRVLAAALCLVIGAVAWVNGTEIYNGYAANQEVLLRNEEKILAAKEEAGDSDEPLTIVLEKLPDIQYCCEMVYTPGYESMAKWMNRYYELPQGTIYIFEDSLP